MNRFQAMVILVFVFLISMTENGWILNSAGSPGPIFKPDSYMENVHVDNTCGKCKGGSSNEGDDKSLVG